MINYTEIECCNCGVLWQVSDQLDKNWHKTKKTFYCPNGHGQSYTESTAEVLQKRLDEKNNLIFRKDQEILSLEKKLKKCKK